MPAKRTRRMRNEKPRDCNPRLSRFAHGRSEAVARVRSCQAIPATTKPGDRRNQLVPIHPRIRPIIEKLPRRTSRVLPGLSSRKLLEYLKDACVACGLGHRFEEHSFRHHFASLCASLDRDARARRENSFGLGGSRRITLSSPASARKRFSRAFSCSSSLDRLV